MTIKPTYAELESTVKALKRDLALLKKPDNTLIRLLSEDFKQLAGRLLHCAECQAQLCQPGIHAHHGLQ
jgi:hypothetical protein